MKKNQLVSKPGRHGLLRLHQRQRRPSSRKTWYYWLFQSCKNNSTVHTRLRKMKEGTTRGRRAVKQAETSVEVAGRKRRPVVNNLLGLHLLDEGNSNEKSWCGEVIIRCWESSSHGPTLKREGRPGSKFPGDGRTSVSNQGGHLSALKSNSPVLKCRCHLWYNKLTNWPQLVVSMCHIL